MKKPDSTLIPDIAIEFKLLQEKKRLGKITDEIGADKQAYKKAYGSVLFGVLVCHLLVAGS